MPSLFEQEILLKLSTQITGVTAFT